MKPRTIGIVGGAGPMAGVLLLERIFQLATNLYGCHHDADFPQLILLSFPFSDMLSSKIDEQKVRDELKSTLDQLRKNGAEVLAIACNTLHAFLEEDPEDLVHLPKGLIEDIPTGEAPLVLCTSASAKFGLHKRFFPCVYPSAITQRQVDQIIDQLLGGADLQETALKLLEIIGKAQAVVLGCTELSLLNKHLSKSNKLILDPLEIAAKKILELSFVTKKELCPHP